MGMGGCELSIHVRLYPTQRRHYHWRELVGQQHIVLEESIMISISEAFDKFKSRLEPGESEEEDAIRRRERGQGRARSRVPFGSRFYYGFL
jgi:hypothetical protein